MFVIVTTCCTYCCCYYYCFWRVSLVSHAMSYNPIIQSLQIRCNNVSKISFVRFVFFSWQTRCCSPKKCKQDKQNFLKLALAHNDYTYNKKHNNNHNCKRRSLFYHYDYHMLSSPHTFKHFHCIFHCWPESRAAGIVRWHVLLFCGVDKYANEVPTDWKTASCIIISFFTHTHTHSRCTHTLLQVKANR